MGLYQGRVMESAQLLRLIIEKIEYAGDRVRNVREERVELRCWMRLHLHSKQLKSEILSFKVFTIQKLIQLSKFAGQALW